MHLIKFGQLLIILLVFNSCGRKYTPKPRSFFRIDFPEKIYHQLQGDYPYSFDLPDYSFVEKDTKDPNQPYWINVEIPANKAEIHLSYYNLRKSKQKPRNFLIGLMEETRSLAYKHSIKADAIDEQIFINHRSKVYGTVYRIRGNAASPMQFFLTDSTTHFLRGAFYIREVPDIDSLRPVIQFIEPDVIRLIETTNWK